MLSTRYFFLTNSLTQFLRTPPLRYFSPNSLTPHSSIKLLYYFTPSTIRKRSIGRQAQLREHLSGRSYWRNGHVSCPSFARASCFSYHHVQLIAALEILLAELLDVSIAWRYRGVMPPRTNAAQKQLQFIFNSFFNAAPAFFRLFYGLLV